MSSPRLTDPLKRPAFRRLAVSYAINEMGDWLGLIALSVLVFDLTDSALATTLLFLGTGFLPALLTPFLVARLERPPPRLVLPSLYAGEAAAFLALAILADNFSLTAVVVVAAIDGALALTAKTLTRAVTAAMLEPAGELRGGNAILNVAFTGASAIGPVAGGGLVAAFGVQPALLLDAVSFYVIAWIMFFARPLPQAEPEPGRMLEQARAGFAYLRRNVTLGRLIGVQAVALIFFAAVVPIEVVYAKETLGVGDTGYGILLGSWGVGMVLGGAAFAALRSRSLRGLILLSTIAIGVGYLGMAAAPTLAVACVASALGGAGNGAQWVAVVSAVQELTKSTMQARVLSVLESVGAATPGIGFALGGLVAAGFGPRTAFTMAGLGALAVAAIAIPLLGHRWPERAPEQSASGGPDDAEGAVMVELIPAVSAGGLPSPTWRS